MVLELPLTPQPHHRIFDPRLLPRLALVGQSFHYSLDQILLPAEIPKDGPYPLELTGRDLPIDPWTHIIEGTR